MLPSEAGSASHATGALCARHPAVPAIGICARCGSYACAECARLGEDGLDYCSACVALAAPVLAERSDRFVANLVDQFLVALPWLGAAFAGGVLGALSPGGEEEVGALLGGFSALGVLGMFAVAAYQLSLVSRTGQTLGKRMRRIRVVRTDGSPVSGARIFFLRNLVPLLIGSLCGLFSLIDALLIFNEDRRCLHDMLADTKVVKVDPETGRD